jgi:hypothetical protein
MMLWLLIALGEFFCRFLFRFQTNIIILKASPALALADGYTLNLVSETPKDVCLLD